MVSFHLRHICRLVSLYIYLHLIYIQCIAVVLCIFWNSHLIHITVNHKERTFHMQNWTILPPLNLQALNEIVLVTKAWYMGRLEHEILTSKWYFWAIHKTLQKRPRKAIMPFCTIYKENTLLSLRQGQKVYSSTFIRPAVVI